LMRQLAYMLSRDDFYTKHSVRLEQLGAV
jgi:hypothetical protein